MGQKVNFVCPVSLHMVIKMILNVNKSVQTIIIANGIFLTHLL